ncbi:primosomal protein N' [Erysipelothrix sp. HDW6A]|uniref:replication restart helicase PriA n=1 Tax=Erysipelothrix sp. HDW6A TaxID=2714928 RepID=UPI001F0F1699|nr:primosomal protein N' [Erysipelothrix sp. HDW6A]
MYCEVYIENSFLGNKTLTYDVGGFSVARGMRVSVSLRNREIIGFVASVHNNKPEDFEAMPILSVLDDTPILNEELWLCADWLAYRTVSPIIRCLQTILPNKLKPQTSSKKAKKERIIVRTDLTLHHPTAHQERFLDHFKQGDSMTVKEAVKLYSGFRTLIDKGLFDLEDREVVYSEQMIESVKASYQLTDKQAEVIKKVSMTHAHTYLLHGVTGSGKTEVYLQLAESVIKENKQVLILVPEISLTPQMIERVSTRFGQDVAIYHSGLNDQEKYEQYQRVRNHEVNILVGTRSAVFMPFKELGLIVMDEEHDTSYKQENTPYYHTRDVAIWRSEYHNCPLLLGSASPSLETYARSLKGVYTLLELNERINHQFPKVSIIDTRKALLSRQSAYLTDELLEAIHARLERKEQIVLLLNRRGYMTLIKNSEDEVLQCPNCDLSLSYHKTDRSLRCHVCGYQTGLKNNMKLVGSGVGTQRLEENVQALFPNARIARMDADTTSKKNAHQRILKSFIDHECDILIGTQMIAKGLDIPNVTLVGIINADTALAHSDYRAVETTFAMLLQAAGRSGRGGLTGEVMLQTANPDHYAIQCALHQQYKKFVSYEMQYRKIAEYPPYSYLISIVFNGDTEEETFAASLEFMKILNGASYQLIGPVMLRKLVRKYRSRIIIKGKDLDGMIQLCHQAIDLFKKTNRTGVNVDVNPLTLES